jgi:hypothetical protein
MEHCGYPISIPNLGEIVLDTPLFHLGKAELYRGRLFLTVSGEQQISVKRFFPIELDEVA